MVNKEFKKFIHNDHFYQKIEAIMKEYQVVGLQAVSILKDDVIWSDSLGYRNRETREPVTENTMFRIASVSKLFTAIAIMQLVETQKIKLDEDISKYLGFIIRNPNYPETKITLKQILTHTSSLTSDDQSNSIYAKFIKDGACNLSLSLEQLVVPGGKYYTNHIWGNWEPGDSSNWVYSNIGAIICGAIIEKVSNMRFDHYIQETIFKPLGMNHVAFSYAGMKQSHEFANLYELDGQTKDYKLTIEDTKQNMLSSDAFSGYLPGTHGGLFEPQGGLRTTALELSKFLRAHMNGEYNKVKLLNRETSNLMKSVHWSRMKENHFFSKMGLGFHISQDLLPKYEMIGHAGEAYGLLSNLYWNEEKKFGIIFILNGADFNLQSNTRFEVEKDLAEVIYECTIENLI